MTRHSIRIRPVDLRLPFDLSFLTGRSRPLIGLDISSSAVKMVELSENARGYRVERYAIEPLARDAVKDGSIADMDSVAEAVRRGWKRLGTATRQVALALPAAAVITKKIVVAAGLREQDLETQVEAEANHYIPFALDEVNLDFQVLGPLANSPEEVEVLIAASRRDRVEDRVAAAQTAGLQARVVDVESHAAQAAFELIEAGLVEAGDDPIVVLADVGADLMTVTVRRGDEVLYTREQAFGGNHLTQEIARQFGMTDDTAEAAKRSGTLPDSYDEDLRRPFLESMAVEVSRALQFFFTSTQYSQVDHIVLAGGCAVMEDADSVVARRTGVRTTVGNPFAGMALAPHIKPQSLAADAPALLVACGLALRRFDPE